jgi:hypothetical protein
MDAKTKAIVAHITIIGWIIALVANSREKDPLAAFYIRQTLGIMLIGLFAWVKFIGIFISIACLVLWIISLVGAIQGEERPVPVLGEYFQEWFGGL